MPTEKDPSIVDEEMSLQPDFEESVVESSSSLSQTDFETKPNEEFPEAECTEEGNKAPMYQTDSNFISKGAVDAGENSLYSQTETEMKNNLPEGTKSVRHTRGIRTKKVESDTEDSTALTDEVTAVLPPVRRRRIYPRPTTTVLSIDEKLSVETEADEARDALLDLMESLKTRHILTGTIQGIERLSDNPTRSFAVLYHGDFKVIIPAEEAVKAPEDFQGRKPAEVMYDILTKRLGAEVDYIIKGIDGKAGIAVASRLEAMAQKSREYYFGVDRDGNHLLYEGACAEARVVSVIRAGIFVDLFGIEIYIPLRELSYQRMMDAQTSFQPGQRVLVKILHLDRTDRNHIKVNASIKQARENPYEKALRRYTVGNRYVGTVSMVDINGVFVALDGGIDCLCSYPKRGRPPRGARVTVRILGINNESNRIWGAITHIAVPR